MNTPAPDTLPSSIADVTGLVRQAYAQTTPIHICGNQSLWIRSMNPPAGVHIMSLRRMDRLEWDKDNLVAWVGSGMPTQHLQDRLKELGLVWPVERLEPCGTVGGLICSGRGSARQPADAPARRWILGAKIVTGRGEVATIGGATVKNSSGYGLTHAMWGSAGQLGAIVEVTIRLRHLTAVDADVNPPELEAQPAVFGAPIQVRCDELSGPCPDSYLSNVPGTTHHLISGDQTRAIIGFENPREANRAVTTLTSHGYQATIDYPPSCTTARPNSPNSMWLSIRSAVDPAGVFV